MGLLNNSNPTTITMSRHKTTPNSNSNSLFEGETILNTMTTIRNSNRDHHQKTTTILRGMITTGRGAELLHRLSSNPSMTIIRGK